MKQMGKFRGSEKDYYYLNSAVTSQERDAGSFPVSPRDGATGGTHSERSSRAGALTNGVALGFSRQAHSESSFS